MKAETFKKALHSFHSEMVGSTKKGRKKKGRLIHVQNTSKSRRAFKARGSTGCRKGRPQKDVVATMKRPREPVSFCIPKRKRVKKAHPHSLSKSVDANRAAEKKH